MIENFERMKVYKQLMDEQRKREQEERFCDYLDNFWFDWNCCTEVVGKKQVLEYNPEKEKMAWREYKIYSRNVQIDFYEDFSDYTDLLKALFSELVSVSYSKQELSFTLASWID